MEDDAIRQGFEHLRPSAEFDDLYMAALCRAEADWLIGINGTRRYSALCHRKGIRIGRVMSPTLAMLVHRQTEIKAFVPSRFYTVELAGGGVKSVSEPINDKKDADRLVSACGGAAVVKQVERTRKERKPPMLFDLFCSGDCSFVLWKDSGYLSKAGIALSRELAAELLENGEAYVEDVRFHDSHEGYLVLVELGGKNPSYKYRATDREPI